MAIKKHKRICDNCKTEYNDVHTTICLNCGHPTRIKQIVKTKSPGGKKVDDDTLGGDN